MNEENTQKEKVHALWSKRQGGSQGIMFNGASNIAQEGAISALSEKGQMENKKVIAYYMNNAKMIKNSLTKLGLKVFGGENAPYVWVKTGAGFNSWGFFDKLLKEAHVVSTPGSGFGLKGEGFIRLSAFADKKNVKKALESIEKNLKL